MTLLLVAMLIFLVNVFFGYWRANTRRLSWQWFLAIHIPVPIAVSLRLWLLSGFSWATLPIFVAVFFGGQYTGGRLRCWLEEQSGGQLSSCLVMDLARGRFSAAH